VAISVVAAGPRDFSLTRLLHAPPNCWSSCTCGAPGKERCGTVCWRNIIISATSSRGKHLKYLVWGQGRRSPAWHGPRLCVICAVATSTLAGTPKHAVVTSAHRLQPAIPDSALGNGRALGVAYPGRMGRGISATGSASTANPITSWRHSWIRNDSAEPVTVRPTGVWLGQDGRDGASNPTATCRTGRSRGEIRWRAVSRAAHGAR